ncbi:MAG: MFS transporter [Clostridiales bacterium]|nr:MFS transporter [Clostridiales bacterium]MCD8368470.1 MFS transporter [Clostridiales bacterium]
MTPSQTKPLSYDHTIRACFVGYIVQAIVNNFVPLLFLTFQSAYGIPLSSITLLITFNFTVQLVVDLLSPRFIDRVGYRAAIVLAHVMAAAGLIGLAVLPDLLPSPFAGLVTSVLIYAVGGGLLEVLVSPIVEACPTDNKESAMSLLHSFYCWGHVGVVLLSTIFFTAFGTERWKILALLWAVVPIANCIIFTRVPIYSLLEEGEQGLSMKELLGRRTFWLALVLMICAGASEQAVSQWTSTFAESGLQVSKTLGDLCGPMFFAILMGTARALYGKYGARIDLVRTMKLSAGLCVVSYLVISLSPWPMLSLLGCGVCGFSVGILWPGTFSMTARLLPRGGTLLFALLALGGDIGCSAGPTFVGMISSLAGGDLHAGILAAVFFPVLMLLGSCALRKAEPTA